VEKQEFPATVVKSSRRTLGNGHAASALLDDQVHDRIHAAIAAQELPPGIRLREDQMRQIFGVSRARIRKVFARLAFEGLVTIEPNRGASVAKPSPDEARENFAARRAIEATIVRMVADRFEPRHKTALARHIAKETCRRKRGATPPK